MIVFKFLLNNVYQRLAVTKQANILPRKLQPISENGSLRTNGILMEFTEVILIEKKNTFIILKIR